MVVEALIIDLRLSKFIIIYCLKLKKTCFEIKLIDIKKIAGICHKLLKEREREREIEKERERTNNNNNNKSTITNEPIKQNY